MIHGLSPQVRRILAVGLAVLLLLLGGSLIAKLANATGEALDDLEDARFRSARLTALSQRPPTAAGTPIPEDLLFRGPALEAAQIDFAGRIAAAAANAQLTLDPAPALPPDGISPALRMPIAATGPEQSLLSFVNQLEQGRPVIRLSSWRIAPQADPALLRIEGVAIAAWEGAK